MPLTEEDREEFAIELSLMDGGSGISSNQEQDAGAVGPGFSATTSGGFADPLGVKPGGGAFKPSGNGTDFDISSVPEDLRFEFLQGKKDDGDITSVQFAAGMVGQNRLDGKSLSVGDRLSIAFLSNTVEEQQAAFKRLYPSGDYQSFDGVEVFRRHPSDRYAIADKPFLDNMTALGPKDSGELAIDAAELLASEALPIAGEVAASIAFRNPAASAVPRGLLRRLARAPVVAESGAAAGGSLTQQQIQTLAGTQRQSFPEQLAGAGAEGVASLVGGSATTIFHKGKQLSADTLSLFRRDRPGAREANEVLEEVGGPPLFVSQRTTFPAGRVLGKIAERIDPTLSTKRFSQQNAVAVAVEGRRNAGALSGFHRTARERLASESEKLILGLKRRLRIPDAGSGKSLRQRSEIMGKELEAYSAESQARVSQLYAISDAQATPHYDMPSILDDIESLSDGTSGLSYEIPIFNAAGMVESTFREKIGIVVPEGKLKTLLDKAQNLDVNATGEGIASGTEQIERLRSAAFEESLPPAGEVRGQQHGIALNLYRLLSDVLDNPSFSGPGGEVAKASRKEARDAARVRFETLEKAIVVEFRAAHADNMAPMLRKLFNKDQEGNISFLFAAMSPNGHRQIRQGFSDILLDTLRDEGPEKVLAKLDSLDRHTLDILMPRQRVSDVRFAAEQLKKFNSSAVANGVKNQHTFRGFVNEIMTTTKSRTSNLEVLRQLRRESRFAPRAKGRPFVSPEETDFAVGLRAAIFDNILEGPSGALRFEPGGGIRLDKKAFAKQMKQVKDAGLLEFLTRSDRRVLSKMAKANAFVGDEVASGSSIEAARVGGEAFSIKGFSSFIQSVLSANLMSRLLVSKVGKKLFLSSDKIPEKVVMDRLWKTYGSFLATVTAQQSDQEDSSARLNALRRASQ